MSTQSRQQAKEKLEAESRKYQDALEDDVTDLVDRAKSILTGVVVIGIGFWVAYKLFKALSHEEAAETEEEVKEANEQTASVFSIVKHTILKELAIFLLGIIKEKAIEYLQEATADEEDTGNTAG